MPEFQNWELGLSVWKKVGSSLSSKLSLEIPTLCIICLISKPSALDFSKRIVNTSSIAQDTNLLSFTLRADSSAGDYREINTSEEVVTFGNSHLGQPRPTSGIKKRVFFDLPHATIERRKEMDKENTLDSKTLLGISSVYEIICEVLNEGKYN